LDLNRTGRSVPCRTWIKLLTLFTIGWWFFRIAEFMRVNPTQWIKNCSDLSGILLKNQQSVASVPDWMRMRHNGRTGSHVESSHALSAFQRFATLADCAENLIARGDAIWRWMRVKQEWNRLCEFILKVCAPLAMWGNTTPAGTGGNDLWNLQLATILSESTKYFQKLWTRSTFVNPRALIRDARRYATEYSFISWSEKFDCHRALTRVQP
jgi:hypothetical protein